jgi:hypothetical protein
MTQGGVGVHHDIDEPTIKQTVVKDLTPIQEHLGLQLHKGRAGFYGWLGLGGSVA